MWWWQTLKQGYDEISTGFPYRLSVIIVGKEIFMDTIKEFKVPKDVWQEGLSVEG